METQNKRSILIGKFGEFISWIKPILFKKKAMQMHGLLEN